MNENKATLPGGLRLQFTPQDYQTRAVNAVVQAFEGQPISSPGFRLQQTSGSVEYAPDGSIANQLLLTEEQILQNVQRIQSAMAEEQEKQNGFVPISRWKWKPARAKPTPSSRPSTS